MEEVPSAVRVLLGLLNRVWSEEDENVDHKTISNTEVAVLRDQINMMLTHTDLVIQGGYAGEAYRLEHRALGHSGKSVPGQWVHIINSQLPSSDVVKNLAKCTGEVCVSDYDKGHFYTAHQHWWGFILEGVCSYTFKNDCWSYRLPDGRRAQGDQHGGPRTEGWLVPATAKIVGFITNSDSFASILAKFGSVMQIASPRPSGWRIFSPVMPEDMSRAECRGELEAWGFEFTREAPGNGPGARFLVQWDEENPSHVRLAIEYGLRPGTTYYEAGNDLLL